MQPPPSFCSEFLQWDRPERAQDRVWRYDHPVSAHENKGEIVFDLAFKALGQGFAETGEVQDRFRLRLRACGPEVLRIRLSPDDRPFGDESPMLELSQAAAPVPLHLEEQEDAWIVRDAQGRPRARLAKEPVTLRGGSQNGTTTSAALEFLPDGVTAVPLMGQDSFSARPESLPLAFSEHEGGFDRALFSFVAEGQERFAGTGERFRKLDLSGGTYTLRNTDALGCNSPRAYKNVPFFLSSRPYGLFLHTSAHLKLSLADLSTRAAQGVVDEPELDLFLIGGGDWERILCHYRELTGFPPLPPLWTFGTWMSRMTYRCADEVRAIARRLRDEDFPCDVIHLDTGWFKYEWVCDWRFSEERFPDPEGMIAELREDGFRLSLWQTPYIGKWSPVAPEAEARGVLAKNSHGSSGTTESHFAADTELAYIDFSNPAAVKWYQEEMLRPLLEMGVAAIKTDFGEDIDLEARYAGLDAAKLHNLYSLLYQRAAAEITAEVTGATLIFARSGWAGSQRYPVHWAGDTAGTWEGMAGALRGGLHLGLSGFAFWSHDVGGFYGVPDFMSSKPDPALYARWTQLGVLSSHLRYHGTTEREPFAYPEVAPIVRKWLKLRYALLPWFLERSREAVKRGRPFLAPLVLDFPGDPNCWHLDDTYLLGEDLLVAPILDPSGSRSVYLPEGEWIDLWSGERWTGPRWLRDQQHTLETVPIFVRAGATLAYWPTPVASTAQIRPTEASMLSLDRSFRGIAHSPLGPLCGFEPQG